MIPTSSSTPSLRSFLHLGVVALLATAIACGGRGDATIESEVRERLNADPTTRNMNLTVSVSGGEVRLSGQTTNRPGQERAVEIAQSVNGVSNVVDEIQVNESPLAEAVRSALREDEMVGDIPIEVEVEETLVRLRSDQTNQEQRTRAVQIARGVQGVEAVEDLMK